MENKQIKWTFFWDMYSGGAAKEPYEEIYIEAPRDEAIVIFYNRFGHNPLRVTCACCGCDYSVEEGDTLDKASAYHRNCEWDQGANCYKTETGKSIAEYEKQKNVLIIRDSEIKADERVGEVPIDEYEWL